MPEAPRIAVLDVEALREVVRAELQAVLSERPLEAGEWLDAKGVGKLLGVHPRSVQKMVRHQGLPGHKIGEKLYRYRRSEVEAWIKDNNR